MAEVYCVGFDRSYLARKKHTRYENSEAFLCAKAEHFKGIGINMSDNEFNFLFRDFNLANAFYGLLEIEKDSFPETFKFRKFSLEEKSFTEIEQEKLEGLKASFVS